MFVQVKFKSEYVTSLKFFAQVLENAIEKRAYSFCVLRGTPGNRCKNLPA